MKTEELDSWIAEHVMGQKLPTEIGFRYLDGRENWGNSPEYTVQKYTNYKAQGVADCLLERPNNSEFSPTSVEADAMEVLKKCIFRCHRAIQISQSDDKKYHVMSETYTKWIGGDTLPLAICNFARLVFDKEAMRKPVYTE